MKKVFISIINNYQKYLSFDTGMLKFLAPGGACKFTPTCSEYTKQAIIEHGVIKGLFRGFKRILICR